MEKDEGTPLDPLTCGKQSPSITSSQVNKIYFINCTLFKKLNARVVSHSI